ncbi:MAG TPA: HXXEE domain-containing protein [Woeseiaceae bacterium]|nr:HXXEE domain-containing protein [Woeseiaceae bacterium]
MVYLPGLLILGLVALMALHRARTRKPLAATDQRLLAASRALALATAVQFVHFSEEWATGFNVRFPALFDLDPIPGEAFVVFNLAWIATWLVAIPMLRKARTFAFFVAWFLAIAGLLNGIAHPLLAAATDGYFPGLISSPFIGVAGLSLWRRLNVATTMQ